MWYFSHSTIYIKHVVPQNISNQYFNVARIIEAKIFESVSYKEISETSKYERIVTDTVGVRRKKKWLNIYNKIENIISLISQVTKW